MIDIKKYLRQYFGNNFFIFLQKGLDFYLCIIINDKIVNRQCANRFEGTGKVVFFGEGARFSQHFKVFTPKHFGYDRSFFLFLPYSMNPGFESRLGSEPHPCSGFSFITDIVYFYQNSYFQSYNYYKLVITLGISISFEDHLD